MRLIVWALRNVPDWTPKAKRPWSHYQFRIWRRVHTFVYSWVHGKPEDLPF